MKKRDTYLRNKIYSDGLLTCIGYIKSALTEQCGDKVDNHEAILEAAGSDARFFVKITGGIAVLSDFSRRTCHTFAGRFGMSAFGLSGYPVDENSPFEDFIFDVIPFDNLVNRHPQDFLSALKVANTAAAVEIGMRLKLI